MSMVQQLYLSPTMFTTTEARAEIASKLGGLQRRLGELTAAVADRDRIIARLQCENGALKNTIADQLARIEELRDSGDSTRVNKLLAEIERWRGVLTGIGSAIDALAHEYAPVKPEPDGTIILPPTPSAVTVTQAAKVTTVKKQPGQCAIAWCERKRSVHGMCATHYGRSVKYGDPLLRKVSLGKGGKAGMWMERETGPGMFERVDEHE